MTDAQRLRLDRIRLHWLALDKLPDSASRTPRYRALLRSIRVDVEAYLREDTVDLREVA